MKIVVFFYSGGFFGETLQMSEVSSWFRVYEIFQFNSFYMSGVICSALFYGELSTFVVKELKIKSIFEVTTITIV